MNHFLLLLLSFFALRAEGDPDPNPDPAPDPQPDPDPAAPAGDNLELDLGGEGDPAPVGDPAPDYKAEAETARREAAAARERADRLEVEARNRATPPVDHEARLRADEDRVLNDPNSTELQKWQINANRELRGGQRVAAQALFQSNDMADRTNFEQLAVTKPALYTRYKDEVDRRLAQARSQGANPSRADILRWLIGQDAMDGKLAPKKAKSPAAPARPTVPRGSLPAARGDVPARGGAMSNREKLARKLENVQI